MSSTNEPDDAQARSQGAAAYARFLSRLGRLAKHAATAPAAEYAWLCGGVYEIIWLLVFEGLTRGIERRRGHRACAVGIAHLEPDCLDRYQDDVEAVLEDVLRHATIPIHNLEGWVSSRLVQSTVDGNRRRRGERGALQRPRLAQWLERLIGDDPWLRVLALEILTWVGVPATAGAGLWPYGGWADRRAAVTGELHSTEKDVERDVEQVLALMRRNAPWYEQYVERPLGRKQAPLPHSAAADAAWEWPRVAMTDRHQVDDALRLELAAAAIEAMQVRFARGEDRRSVVIEVIGAAFGAGLPDMDQAPGADCADDEPVTMLLADGEAIDRLVREVCQILGVPEA